MIEGIIRCKCKNTEFYILANTDGGAWLVCTKCENRADIADVFTFKK